MLASFASSTVLMTWVTQTPNMMEPQRHVVAWIKYYNETFCCLDLIKCCCSKLGFIEVFVLHISRALSPPKLLQDITTMKHGQQRGQNRGDITPLLLAYHSFVNCVQQTDVTISWRRGALCGRWDGNRPLKVQIQIQL